MLSALRRAIGGARDGIRARAHDVWRRDRARLKGGRALANRILRIVVFTIRGVSVHRLGLQAAALTYYTVFSLVPLLVVVFWILKTFDHLSTAPATMPVATELANANAALHGFLRKLFENVNHATQVRSGTVGLLALLYAVVRLFAHAEGALDLIASSTKREAKFFRLFGYLALLLLPPLLSIGAGMLAGAHHNALGSEITRRFGSAARLKVAISGTVGLSASWLAIAIFYSAAARARIPFSSAAVGAAVAAILLSAVLWAFAEFQIGMSHGNSVQFGAAAAPAFLLLTFSSWYVVLLGAEIAVGHSVDRVLVQGAWCFHLDALAEQETGVEIMVRATRGNVSVDGLARELRVGPQPVRRIGCRLVERGLLSSAGLDRFALACNPDRVSIAEVMDAVARDPALESARRARVEQRPFRAGGLGDRDATQPRRWSKTARPGKPARAAGRGTGTRCRIRRLGRGARRRGAPRGVNRDKDRSPPDRRPRVDRRRRSGNRGGRSCARRALASRG